MSMNIQQADKIVQDYASFTERTAGKLNALFLGTIPESLLPYNKDLLEKALNIMAKYYVEDGQKNLASSMETLKTHLLGYSDDKQTIDRLAERFKTEDFRAISLQAIKEISREIDVYDKNNL